MSIDDKYAAKVKVKILDLIDDVKHLCTIEREVREIELVYFLFKEQEPTFILKKFIEEVYGFKDIIRKKDKNFFLDNPNIFKVLGPDRIAYYSNKIRYQTSDNDIACIFEHFEAIIEDCENFIEAKSLISN